MSMLARAVPILVALLFASPAAAGAPWCARAGLDAQPRCKKGCLCGNSCISCSKTCRMSAPAERPAPPRTPIEASATARPFVAPLPAAAPAQTADPQPSPSIVTKSTVDSLERVIAGLRAQQPMAKSTRSLSEVIAALERDDPGAVGLTVFDYFAASRSNKLYFRASCPLFAVVERSDRMVWPDSTLMLRSGFKRIALPTC